MTLLRMLAFRPDGAARAAAAAPPASRAAGAPQDAAAADAAAAGAAAAGAPNIRLISIDAGNWPAVVEAAALSGMVRQFALNCVPSSFENDVLTLTIDPAAADRRTPFEEKLVLGLTKYFARAIRVVFETAETLIASPVRQRALAEQERMARAASAFESDPVVKGLRERFGADIDVGSVKPAN
jgi:DNA polymerase-3 subunit gamma/tau